MIGMDVGVDDVPDVHAGLDCRAEIWFDVAQRVDRVSATAEQI